MAVAGEQVNDRILCEAETVVDTETERTLSLGVVVSDLLLDPLEQRNEAVDERVAGVGDSRLLIRRQRVPRRYGHTAVISR